MKLPTVKDLVSENQVANFVRYFDGNLWYKTWWHSFMPTKPEDGPSVRHEFEFPVPVSDIGNATFLANDKALLFMRYIRKHLEMLAKAKGE